MTDLEQYDEISGFPVYKVLLCEVSRKKRLRKGDIAMFVADHGVGQPIDDGGEGLVLPAEGDDARCNEAG